MTAPRAARLLTVCFLWLVLGSCSGRAESDHAVVRDSAGVRIVEHSRSLLGKHDEHATDSLRLSAEPLFEHGSGQDHYLFQNIVSGAFLPDGAIVLGDRRAMQVVVLDSAGSLRRIMGGPGEGPREFGRVGAVVVMPDGTVVVEDTGQDRVALIRRDSIVGTVPLADPRLRFALSLFDVIDGELLFSQVSLKPGPGEQWFKGALVRVDLGTAESETVLQYDYFPPEAEFPNTFPPKGVLDLAADRLVLGRTDRAELKWYSVAGEVQQIVRWAPHSAAPTDSLWQAYAEAMSEWGPASGRPPMPARLLAERKETLPERLPLYSLLRGGPGGEVWIGEFTAGSEEVRRWVVLSSEGVPLGSVEMPERFRILDIGEDRILGVRRGDHDVENVVVCMLERIVQQR